MNYRGIYGGGSEKDKLVKGEGIGLSDLMLVSEQTTAANTTLRCFLCSDKQKVSFVSRSTKDLKNTPPGKAWFFCIRFSSKTKSKSEKKIQDNVNQTKASMYAKNRHFGAISILSIVPFFHRPLHL